MTANSPTDDHDWIEIRKRPVVVEARGPYYESEVIETLEGDFEVDKEYATEGFYIIRGVEGEVYPCQLDVFQDTYEILSGGSTSDRGETTSQKCIYEDAPWLLRVLFEPDECYMIDGEYCPRCHAMQEPFL